MRRSKRSARINRAAAAFAVVSTFAALVTSCMNDQSAGDAAPIITTDSPSHSTASSSDEPTAPQTGKPFDPALLALANPCSLVTLDDLKKIFKPIDGSRPGSIFQRLSPQSPAIVSDDTKERNCVYESTDAYVDDDNRYSLVDMTLTVQTEYDPDGQLLIGVGQFARDNGGAFVPIIGTKGAYQFPDDGHIIAEKAGVLIDISANTDPAEMFKLNDSRRILDAALAKIPNS